MLAMSSSQNIIPMPLPSDALTTALNLKRVNTSSSSGPSIASTSFSQGNNFLRFSKLKYFLKYIFSSGLYHMTKFTLKLS